MAVIGIDLGTTNSLVSVWENGQESSVCIMSGNNYLTDDEIEARRKKMTKLSFVEDEENCEIMALAERIYAESVGIIRERIEEIMSYFQRVLRTNSPIKIKKARDKITPMLKEFDAYINRDVFQN